MTNGMTKELILILLIGAAKMIVLVLYRVGIVQVETNLTTISVQINVMTESLLEMKIVTIKYQMLMAGDANQAVKVEILTVGIVYLHLLGLEQT